MAKLVLTIDNKQAVASVESLKKEFNALGKSLSKIEVNKNLTAQINALTKHYKTIADAHAKITTNANKQAIADERLKQQQSKSSAEAVKLAIAQARLEKAQKTTTSTTEQLQKKFANLLSTIKSLKNAYPQGTFDELEKSVRESLNAAKDSKANVDALSKSYDELSAKVAVTKAETEKVTTAVVKSGDSIGKLAKKFLLWQVTATLVMKPLRLITDGLNSINETLVKTEDAVIALQRVLPNGSASDSEISSRLYKIAQDYGNTFENVQQIAVNFARNGMDWADAIKATEAAVLALNVAELDAEQATDGLNAVLSQFGLKASELTGVIDKLNKVADENPVTTEKLLKALQRTGASAKQANISLDETIGIITTLSKATNRSGENLGTAVNSLIQFSSKASSLDVFAKLGGDVETAVEKYRAGAGSIMEIWKELSQVIKERKSDAESILGGGLFSDEEWAGLNEGLKAELGEAYADVTDIYDTASTFRKNYFVALMSDLDNVQKVLGDIDSSQGYSQKENEKYLDTYTAKLNKIQAQWQDIANDEQGLLGIKKDLLDMGSILLDIIKYMGGLKSAIIALAPIIVTIIATTKGAAIVAGLKLIGTTLKSLTIDAIPNFIATLRAWRGQTTLLNGQVVTLTGSTATFGAVLKAALPIISAVILIMAALDAQIRRDIEAEEERKKKAYEAQSEAIKTANEEADTAKKTAKEYANLTEQLEKLRGVLADSTSGEKEKTSAQSQLLNIQKKLVDSNKDYANSLDLTNGKLEEQLGLLDKLSEEQLKKNAQEFLSKNDADIITAQNRVELSDTSSTDMLFTGAVWDRHGFRDIINKAITGTGNNNIKLNEDNTYYYLHNYTKSVEEGFKKDLWSGLWAITGIPEDFDKRSYIGEAKAGFSFTGTTEEKLAAIEQLKEYISKNYKELGLSAEQEVSFMQELKSLSNELNSDEYKQAQKLAEQAKLHKDYIEGRISKQEYLNKLLGIEQKKEGISTNNIKDVTDKYDDLINKLKELRDLEDESVNLEEKKAEYIEAQNELLKAQQALENAKNEATVKRFNEATQRWEWQVDEKKVASAEEAVKKQQESVDKAKKDLEKQTYDAIIQALEKQTATNDSLIEVLKSVRDLLGNDFVNTVQGGINDITGVDLTQPIKSYDGGGIANGLGFMPKATAQPESVNDPELTRKILSPVSSAEFDRYVKNMGIMFQQAHTYAQTPIIQRVGATDNSVNNSGQVHIAGITFPAEAQHTPLSALVGQFKQIPR